jgi:methylmalonyl-CoA/ethylmalonyl-CoA epimerase
MTGVRDLVEDLAGADAGHRAAAFWQLYRAGCELAEEVFAQWRQDPEFAVLVTGVPIVGVAVPPDLFMRIRQEMDMPPLAGVPEEQSTAEIELHHGGARLDILTPVDNEGAIQKFLDRFGPGIQQVELPVNSVDQAAGVLSERFGLSPVYPQPRAGANGTRMNFFLVGRPGGGKVLIELFEAKR